MSRGTDARTGFATSTSPEGSPGGPSEREFLKVSALVKKLCGINLHAGKKELVRARLSKRLRALGIAKFRDYLHFVEHDPTGNELTAMLDALSTNLTSFFRESEHFEYLANKVLKPMRDRTGPKGRRLRIWSAGCSSGEEPYSIALTVREVIPDLDIWDARVLATDLSTRVLAKARDGVYDEARVESVPRAVRARHFTRPGGRSGKTYRVDDNVRDMVRFARLNLMEHWPMKGPFDVIFCRNVMIYFEKSTQKALVNRFHDILASGGVLFIGHSEGLSGFKHPFQYAQPTVYRRT